MAKKARKEPVCCDHCGRDTLSSTNLCRRCRTHEVRQEPSEMANRKALPTDKSARFDKADDSIE